MKFKEKLSLKLEENVCIWMGVSLCSDWYGAINVEREGYEKSTEPNEIFETWAP